MVRPHLKHESSRGLLFWQTASLRVLYSITFWIVLVSLCFPSHEWRQFHHNLMQERHKLAHKNSHRKRGNKVFDAQRSSLGMCHRSYWKEAHTHDPAVTRNPADSCFMWHISMACLSGWRWMSLCSFVCGDTSSVLFHFRLWVCLGSNSILYDPNLLWWRRPRGPVLLWSWRKQWWWWSRSLMRHMFHCSIFTVIDR